MDAARPTAPRPPHPASRHEAALAIVEQAIRDHYGTRLISLAVFGSVGRGTPHDESDIDLLIVAADLPRGRVARAEEFQPIERQVAARMADAPGLSPVFKTPEEARLGSPLFLDMIEDARILADQDGFLADQLARLAARLCELGSRRIWRDGWWYWDLKPDYRPGEVFQL